MIELKLPPNMIKRLEDLYAEMEDAYDKVASELDFGCQGCSDNCCDSYFMHYTYLEWSYLWIGFCELPQDKQREVLDRAQKYIAESGDAIEQNERPQVMCPLNENGLCIVYKYRLMVCRTHGVPAAITRPDGKKLHFPGCFRCQEIQGDIDNSSFVERTPMLRQLALMENELLDNKRHLHAKVKLTIAEMLVKGPPRLPQPFCSKTMLNRECKE